MNVTVIGMGYVGQSTAAAFSKIGYFTKCFDSNYEKLKKLESGESVISEPYVNEYIHYNNTEFVYNIADAIKDADIIFITVGTPSLPDGSANLEYVFSAAKDIANNINTDKHVCVVIKSTVPVGTGCRIESLIRDIVYKRNLCINYIHFASNPEFLREGNAVLDMLYPNRIVIGTNDQKATEMLTRLYSPIINRQHRIESEYGEFNRCVITDSKSAEMIKYASNAFLALKISYINEVSCLAEKFNCNVNDIARGMGLDERISSHFLKHGLGWGGSCFPKDTAALLSMAKDNDCNMQIVQSAIDVNNRQKDRLIKKVTDKLGNDLSGKTIAVFGTTFKPGTDDVRNSPAIDIAKRFIGLGATVKMTDPVGLQNARQIYCDEQIMFCNSPISTAKDADAVIIATDWQCYLELDWHAIACVMRTKLLFDARNVLTNIKDTLNEFYYEGL